MMPAFLLAEYSPEMAFIPLFWIGLGLIVAGALLLGLLTPDSPAPGPTQVTERGGYIPLLIGKHRVGSSILWRGNRSTVDIDIDDIGNVGFTAQNAAKGGGDDDVTGVLEEGMVGLCIGCATVIEQIYLNGAPALSTPISQDTGQGNGFAVNYLSADKANGTFLRPYYGSISGYDVNLPSYQRLIGNMGLDTERVPVWPNLTFLHFDKCYLGTQSPRWPRIEADVIVMPQEVDDLTFELHHAQLRQGIGGVNPAYCLYVLLTSESPYGVGIDKDLIDKTSLNTIGTKLAQEEIWININTGNGRTVEEMVQEILNDCGIVMSEVQGILTFSTRREGDTSVTVNEDSLSPPVEKIEILATKFNPTCVEFRFKDSAINFQQNTVTIENDGPELATGTKKNRTQTLTNVTTLDVAQQISQRRGQEFMSLSQAIEVSLARDAREIRPGENITVSGYGTIRVSKVTYDYNSPNVKVNGYKDPWTIPGLSGDDDGSGPVDPRPACVRPTSLNVFLGKTAMEPIRFCGSEPPDTTGGDGGGGKPPGPVNGTCCILNSSNVVECSIRTQKECEFLNGTFDAGSVCEDIECIQPVLGTCCGEHEPGTVSCEDNFTQNQCDNVLNSTFGGGSSCSNIECGVITVRGVCCNPVNTQQPCYVIYNDGSECADGYVLDTSTDTCVAHCCDVVDQVNEGSCCICSGNPQPDCINSTESACSALGGTFSPGVPCCETSCQPCEEPPGPGDDIENDLFVRPIIVPRLMESETGVQKSRLAILRSRANDEITTMRGYARDTPGPISQDNVIGGFNNTPSIPAGTCIDTSGFSIQVAIPHSLRYIFDGPTIQILDNSHFQDLENTIGVRTRDGNKFFFNSGQTLLGNSNVSLFAVRDYSATDVGERKVQAKGLIPQRYGTEPVVDVYSDTVGTIDLAAIPPSVDGNDQFDVCVPRKSAAGVPLLRAASINAIDPNESPIFKSQPGIGIDFIELSKVGPKFLNDEDGTKYFNKQNRESRIGWCSAGNKVSSSYKRTLLGGGGFTNQSQPDISTRGIYHTQHSGSSLPTASQIADLTVEACLPSASVVDTPSQLQFGTAEGGSSTRMRAIVWARIFFGPNLSFIRNISDQSAPGPKYSMSQQGSGGSIWVPVLHREYTTTNATGIGSVTFTASEIVSAYTHLQSNSASLTPVKPFDQENLPTTFTTYISVTCEDTNSTRIPSHAVIGRGGFANLPYLADPPSFRENQLPVPNSADASNDNAQEYPPLDVTKGWDSYIMLNEIT